MGDEGHEENGCTFAQVRVNHVGGWVCWECTVISVVTGAILLPGGGSSSTGQTHSGARGEGESDFFFHFVPEITTTQKSW